MPGYGMENSSQEEIQNSTVHRKSDANSFFFGGGGAHKGITLLKKRFKLHC